MKLFLLPTALGDTPWPGYLPADSREAACRLSRFLVENAKSARNELKRLGHPLPMREIDIEQLPERLDETEIDRLLAPCLTGRETGLMSEAGCPGIADPGAPIVRRAHTLGITVTPLIGPSSLILALMASGLEGQRFAFHGYLPAREPERTKRIIELEKHAHQHRQTQIFIEAPYRNITLFSALLAACRPSSQLCLATDLTLPTQHISTRTIDRWRQTPPPAIDRRPTVFLLLS